MRIPRPVVWAHANKWLELPPMCCLKHVSQDFCLNCMNYIHYTIHSIPAHLHTHCSQVKVLIFFEGEGKYKGDGKAREEREVKLPFLK